METISGYASGCLLAADFVGKTDSQQMAISLSTLNEKKTGHFQFFGVFWSRDVSSCGDGLVQEQCQVLAV